MSSEIDIAGLNVALNEAKWLDLEFNSSSRIAVASFKVLTLPLESFPPEDTTVHISFYSVSRLVAIYKNGKWDDEKAEIFPLNKEELPKIIQNFGGLPIYGWEFVQSVSDTSEAFKKVSFEFNANEKNAYKLRLFQASSSRYLELHLWFDDLTIKNLDSHNLPLEQFIAGGKRFWETIHKKDFRVQGYGIHPLEEKGFEDL